MTEEKKKRGFAAMDPERQREIARQGGKKSHATGRGHQFSSSEAAIAGQKGGAALKKKRGRKWFAEIGVKGGKARQKQLVDQL